MAGTSQHNRGRRTVSTSPPRQCCQPLEETDSGLLWDRHSHLHRMTNYELRKAEHMGVLSLQQTYSIMSKGIFPSHNFLDCLKTAAPNTERFFDSVTLTSNYL